MGFFSAQQAELEAGAVGCVVDTSVGDTGADAKEDVDGGAGIYQAGLRVGSSVAIEIGHVEDVEVGAQQVWF